MSYNRLFANFQKIIAKEFEFVVVIEQKIMSLGGLCGSRWNVVCEGTDQATICLMFHSFQVRSTTFGLMPFAYCGIIIFS